MEIKRTYLRLLLRDSILTYVQYYYISIIIRNLHC